MKLKLVFISVLLIFTIKGYSFSFEKDTIITKEGKELVITFIKHGSLIFEYDDLIIQVDPVMEYVNYADFPTADIILLTHEHPDHLDSIAINILSGRTTRLITNEACNKILGKGEIMRNGDIISLKENIHLKAVPAYNTTPEREFYHPKYRDNGFILNLGGTNVYIAGDTEDIPEMKELTQIDVAFLPVNQPFTMTLKQVISAARRFYPPILYPYHYNDTDVSIIKKTLINDSIDVRIREMQ